VAPPKGIAQWAAAIGKEATVTTREGFTIRVRIEDVRSSYGRVEVRVVPIAGRGAAWVTSKRVKLKG
jgi:hypothetical protein